MRFLILLFCLTLQAQDYKDGISIVQFSAEFTKDSEISLKPFRSYNTHLFYMGKQPKIFESNKIIYIPSICIFNDGELIKKIESGINLKLPENTLDIINKEIENILNRQF
tara:strand:- start:369 stop:698 length:330 start_codon:yes stop_codon:yes gene_type:complete